MAMTASAAGHPGRPVHARRLGGVDALRVHRRVKTVLFAASVLALVCLAFLFRNSGWITPKHGLGYAIGITGASCILLVLLYPLRKRWAVRTRAATVPALFLWHMILGILGPALIVVHTNFHLSATNSTVALVSMLTVVASGLIGRYLHGRLHTGLHGRRAELRDFLAGIETSRVLLGADVGARPEVVEELARIEAEAMRQGSWLGGLGSRSRITHDRARLLAMVDQALPALAEQRTKALRHIDELLSAVQAARSFARYERAFAIWHVLHAPVIGLLVLSAVAHIVAVHLY